MEMNAFDPTEGSHKRVGLPHFSSLMKGIQIQLNLGGKKTRCGLFQHGCWCFFSYIFAHIVSSLGAAQILMMKVKSLLEFMSVPALSGVPADTLYVKYGAVSPQNQATDVREKNPHRHLLMVADYKQDFK